MAPSLVDRGRSHHGVLSEAAWTWAQTRYSREYAHEIADVVSRTEASQARWEALTGVLLTDRDLIIERFRESIRAELESYRDVPDAELEAGFRVDLEVILRSARDYHDVVRDSDLAPLADVGQTRAQQGIPVEDLLLAWRIGVQDVITRAREVAAPLGIGPEEMLDFVQSLSAWGDRAMAIVAGAHRRTELDLARRQQQRREHLASEALCGRLTKTQLREQATACGLDPDCEYIAIRAGIETDGSRVEIERALGLHDSVSPRPGVSAELDGDLAGFLRELPSRAFPLAVGIGSPRPLERIAESFELATRALTTARLFGLPGANSLDTLGLLPSIAADTAVGEALARRYIEPLAASGSEIVESLRALFECDMHIESAAKQLFVHPNTLRYRIARFEELTGANLREVRTQVEVWWALQRVAAASPSD